MLPIRQYSGHTLAPAAWIVEWSQRSRLPTKWVYSIHSGPKKHNWMPQWMPRLIQSPYELFVGNFCSRLAGDESWLHMFRHRLWSWEWLWSNDNCWLWISEKVERVDNKDTRWGLFMAWVYQYSNVCIRTNSSTQRPIRHSNKFSWLTYCTRQSHLKPFVLDLGWFDEGFVKFEIV